MVQAMDQEAVEGAVDGASDCMSDRWYKRWIRMLSKEIWIRKLSKGASDGRSDRRRYGSNI
jgi:hypothetical protein